MFTCCSTSLSCECGVVDLTVWFKVSKWFDLRKSNQCHYPIGLNLVRHEYAQVEKSLRNSALCIEASTRSVLLSVDRMWCRQQQPFPKETWTNCFLSLFLMLLIDMPFYMFSDMLFDMFFDCFSAVSAACSIHATSIKNIINWQSPMVAWQHGAVSARFDATS